MIFEDIAKKKTLLAAEFLGAVFGTGVREVHQALQEVGASLQVEFNGNVN